MKDISVIVPIYNGLKYIPGMIDQIEKATRKTELDLELLLVNDKPDEPIGELNESDVIDIRVIETNHNKGIHGARVYGLNKCTGKYVLFLDQDDYIYEDYFSSQISKIGTDDAVVCDIVRTYKTYRGTIMPMSQIVLLDTMISFGNSIYSPGQVIIKKDAIPAIWMTNILRHNGSDDWFLWISMLKDGRIFAINPQVLFEHRIHEYNSTNNKAEMLRSMYEVQTVLIEQGILSSEETVKLNAQINRRNIENVRIIENSEKKKRLYRKWIDYKRKGKCIADDLNKCGVDRVAIYGAGEIGLEILNELNNSTVEVTCFVDRYVSGPIGEIPVLRVSDDLNDVDAIIISLIDDIEETISELGEYYSIKMIKISELIVV